MTLQDQATSRATPSQLQCCPILSQCPTHKAVYFQPCGIDGLCALWPVPHCHRLIATNLDLLAFSQMTPKRTSAAASSIAAIPNPAYDTVTTTLCSPAPKATSSKHPGSYSASVPTRQAAGNLLSCPRPDSAPWGAICQHIILFLLWDSQCTQGEQPGSVELVNSPDQQPCPL